MPDPEVDADLSDNQDPNPQPDPEEDLPGDEGDDDSPPQDELEVSFGDEAAPEPDPERDSGLVRRLRAEIRERDKRLAAREAPKPVERRPKPTLEECYEADDPGEEFEKRLTAWQADEAAAQEAETTAQKTQEATQQAWQEELRDFARKKAELGAKDFAEAEEEVVSALAPWQQAVLVKASTNSAAVTYALGKRPDKLTALSAITDPIKLAVAVAKLEGTLKVTQKRVAPEPEGTVRGSAPNSPKGPDKVLAKLEAEAERTSDRSKVIAYKRKLRLQGRDAA